MHHKKYEKVKKFIKNFIPSEHRNFKLLNDLKKDGFESNNGSVLTILNYCVSNLDPEKECFTEFGVFKGRTLFGGAYGNKALCIGVDSGVMSSGSPIAKKLSEKLNNVKLYDKRFQDFLNEDVLPKHLTIGVHHYDAAHDYQSHYDGVAKAIEKLSNYAIILIDDVREDVDDIPLRATRKLLKDYEEFEEIRWLKAGTDESHCGHMVLGFKRNSK